MPPIKWTFREATEEDVPLLVSLHTQLEPNESPLAAENAVALFRRTLLYPYYKHFLAYRDTACAGTFALIVMENLGHQGMPFAIIENVVVDRAFRRQGLGRALMEHARTLARQAGCYKLSLSTNLKRREAHAFYESLGMARHGYSFVACECKP